MKNALTSIIIDDEHIATQNLALALSNFCPEIKNIGIAHSLLDGVQLIKKEQPKVVFLDISLTSDETGFDLLELFPNRDFFVIFVTAHAEFGLQAIKHKAFDYILKPINYRELISVVQDIKLTIEKQNMKEREFQKVIPIPSLDGTHLIKPSEILYCEADGSYTQFRLENNKTLVLSKSIKHAEEVLDDKRFLRVHRSFIININKVNKLHFQGGGYVEIDSKDIPISKNQAETLRKLFLT